MLRVEPETHTCSYCGKETRVSLLHVSMLDEKGEKVGGREVCLDCGCKAIDWIMKQATKE